MSGIGTFTGTALALAALIVAQSNLVAANVDPAGAAYVTTPTVAGLLMQRQRFASTDSPLWTGMLGDGVVAGCRAVTTTQMPAGTMLFGRFDTVWLAEWGAPVEIVVNPYANFPAGVIGVRALASLDIGIENAAGFSVATSVT